ncbi:Ankyrin repeat [Trinorchestia longiramus]|nr:Ankyrin repeat [Trinorchestia longiramus]
MGNTESSVSKGVKAQASASLPVYDLLDVNGGGELIDLMKKATKTKDYNELDEAIRIKVGAMAYNKGQGKCLNVHCLVARRNAEKPLSKQITFPKNLPGDDVVACRFQPGVDDPAKRSDRPRDLLFWYFTVTDHETYRYQFWDLAHVGAVGETIVHLCVLNATSVHNELLKRCLKIYPNMINDVYLADEYYGENALHIAIVNEDPAMVKVLLDYGANYHERCIGNFFCAEDQKIYKQDNYLHEWYDLPVKTNYHGYVYWGEYPLSFAACLDQEECYRLILARGANPDNQDTNGNTVTHMMVIFDKIEMFDMCFEAGATISLANRQDLIPMTLACVLARRDLFFHILNITREIYWQIGYVTCAAYPLEYFDTINVKTGETETKSALNLIAYGNKEEHLDLMEGPVVDLLKTKWATFVKFKFYNLFFVFFTYFLISTGAYVLRPVPCVPVGSRVATVPKPAVMVLPALGVTCVNVSVVLADNYTVHEPQVTTFADDEENATTVSTSQLPVQLSPPGSNLAMQSDFEVTAVPDTLRFEVELPIDDDVLSANENEDVSLEASVTELPGDGVTVKYVVEGQEGVLEDCLAVMAMLCTGPYFLFFCRGFKTVGPFVTMIYTMLVGDLLRFVTIYFVFVMGFSQAYYVIYTSYTAKSSKSHCKTNPLSTPVESVLNMFIMSLGNFGSVYEGTECTAHETSGKVLFIVFMAIVSLLLINLLIAMMGNTYTIIAEMKNEWMRQWARIVLVVERGVNPEERLRQQKIYSQPMVDGRPALVLRLHQDEDERDEMQDVLDMKRVHRKYVQRRHAKQQRAEQAALARAKRAQEGAIEPPLGPTGV